MVPHERDEDELDRAAILARRQRFIALALTSMSNVIACGGDPQPCLDVATGVADTGDGMTSTSAGTDSGTSTGSPMPCLDVVPPATESSSGTSGADETATDDTGTGTGTGTTTGDTGTSTGG